MRFLVSFVLAFVLMILPAQAATTAADAAKLKTAVENYINRITSAYKAQGMTVTTEGPVSAENKDTYIALKTPHIKFSDGTKTAINLGVISINALPASEAAQWTMTIAYPTPISIVTKNDKPAGSSDQITLTIPKQSSSGVYDEKVENFTTFKSALSDLMISSSQNKSLMRIGSIDFDQNLTKGPNNLYSGPLNFVLRNLSFSGPDAKDVFSIGGVRMAATYTDLDFNVQKAFQDKMTAVAEAQNSLGAKDASISPQHGMALYKTFVDALTKGSSGFTSQFDITDVSGTSKNKQSGAPEKFNLGRLAFGLDMSGLKTNAAGLSFRTSLNGFTVPSDKGMYGISNPQSINVDLRAKNLPLQELTAMGSQILQSSVTSPETAQMAGLQAMMTIPSMLTKAATGLEVADISIQSPEYSAKLTGNIVTNMNAASGATAKLLGRVTGLDGVLEKLKAGKTTVTKPEDVQNLDQAIKTLTLMQAMGKQGSGGERTYDIELNAQGQTLVNGADFSVFGGGTEKTTP